jgi:PAS domain S-box-containing protein
MSEPLRILIVEDSPADATLVDWELRRAGILFVSRVVETESEFLAALRELPPDLILSDYSLPTFDGMTALRLALEHVPGTPVVMVTGSINEETAVACMRAGAADYVLKDRLARLAPAVNAALERAATLREKRRAEQALRAAEARERARAAELETILDAIPIPVWVTHDASASHIVGNAAADRLLRVPRGSNHSKTPPPGELVGEFRLERDGVEIPPGDLPVQRAAMGSPLPGTQVTFVVGDDERFELMVSSATLRDASGEAAGAVAVGIDMTERLRTEERLGLLWHAIEHTPVTVVVTDAVGCIQYVNPQFSAVTGYTADEAVGQNPRILKSGETPAEVHAALWSTITAGGTWSGELCNRKKNGELFWEQVSISPVRSAAGAITNYVGIKEDITARKAAEADLRETRLQLQHAQKLEAIGRLAGGVAHDFNNLLGVITGYAELLQRDLAGDERRRAKLDQIVAAAQRAAGLTRQLLAFSRRQVLQPRVLDLNVLIGGTETMLGRLIGEDIELQTELDPGLGRVMADPGQLEQVLMNLAVNARDAMPAGGRLTVSTGNYLVAQDDSAQGDLVPPGNYVLVTVSDTGCGMDRETLSRIFEPFFTTKAPDKGTGLGLATVYGIVTQSGGEIRVRSRPQHGTTFRIYLPRIDEVVTSQPVPTLGELPRGEETILLVEDEALLAMLIQETLEACGYRVLVAPRASEAASIAAAHAGAIDLLVTDVVMPGVNGRQVAAAVSALRPGLKVLYISGYTGDVIGALDAGTAFLAKPFSAEELAHKVRAVLAGDPPST